MNIIWAALIVISSAKKVANAKLDTIIYDYLTIDDQQRSFCFRRLNQTGQIGCQSLQDPGNSGTLIFVGNEQDKLDDYLNDSEKVKFFAPYVFLLEISLLTKENIQVLSSEKSLAVAALLVYRNSSVDLASFSPDYPCPGIGSTCSHEWNPAGSGIFWEDYSFPLIFYKNQTIVEKLRDDFHKYNSDTEYPLLQYQVSTFMRAAVDTPTCKRRSELSERSAGLDNQSSPRCDGYNGYITISMFPKRQNGPDEPESLPEKSTVAIVTKSDSLAFFHSTTSGVGAHTGAMMIQLAIGKALKESGIVEKLEKYNRNIVLMTLPAEELKNIGSSSVNFDMENYNIIPVQFRTEDSVVNGPSSKMRKSYSTLSYTLEKDVTGYLGPVQLKIKSLRNIIELGQLDASPENVFLHGESSVDSGVLNSFVRNAASEELSFSPASENNGLPSTLMNAFFESAEAESELSSKSVYVGNFDAQFRNKFHNSMFDDLANFGFSEEYCTNVTFKNEGKKLANYATSVARAAVDLALEQTEFSPGDLLSLTITEDTIQELFCCFLGNPQKCDLISPLFNTTFSGRKFSTTGAQVLPHWRPPRFDFSSTVSGSTAPVPIDVYTNTMIYYTGEDVACDTANLTDCWEKCSQENIQTGVIDRLFEYRLMKNNTICKKSPVYQVFAKSPAAKIENYDYEKNDGDYSLWSESQWNGGLAEGRLFLKQSPTTENVILSVGVISLFFAFLISWLVKWKSASLFTPTQGFLNPVSTIPS